MIFSGVLASRSAAMPEYVNRTVKVIGCFYGCATMKWSALAKRHHADYVPRGDAEVESCSASAHVIILEAEERLVPNG